MESKRAIQIAIISIILIAIVLLFSFLISTNPESNTTNDNNEPENLDDLSGSAYVYSTSPGCPYIYGLDTDKDGIINSCDNCPNDYNPDQLDADLDGSGDQCDKLIDKPKDSDDDDKEDDEGECSSNSECGTNGFIGEPTCSGKNITQTYIEFTCNDAGDEDSECTNQTSTKVVLECDYQCSAGECISEPEENITCSTDADCGQGGFIGQPFCTNSKDLAQFFEYSTCEDRGTTQSRCVPHTTESILETCTDICSVNQCVDINCTSNSECNDNNSSTQDICNNQGTIDSFCSHNPIACFEDSQCGTDGFIGQPFCLFNSIYQIFRTWTCNNPGIGSTCNPNNQTTLLDSCDFACSAGECIRCDENSDCDDSNPDTTDTCILAGTELSDCTHTETCSNECSQGERECYQDGYRICGDFDSDSCYEWSTINQCSTGETCEYGECVTPQPTCTDQCTFGQRECYQDGYRICGDFDSDSCYEWSSKNECSTGEVCEYGECVTPQPTCTNECNFAERTCSSSGTYKICGDFDSDSCYEWSTDNYCSTGDVCIGGNCI